MMQKMDFSVTSRQMTLLHRLLSLFLDFIRGDIKHEPGEGLEVSSPSQSSPAHGAEDTEDGLTLGRRGIKRIHICRFAFTTFSFLKGGFYIFKLSFAYS